MKRILNFKTGILLFVISLNWGGVKAQNSLLEFNPAAIQNGDVLFHNGNSGSFNYHDGTSPLTAPTKQMEATSLKYQLSTKRFSFQDPANAHNPLARLDVDPLGIGFYTHSINSECDIVASIERYDVFSAITNYCGAIPPPILNKGLVFRGTNISGHKTDAMYMNYSGWIGFGNTNPKAQVHIGKDVNSAMLESPSNPGKSENLLVGPYNFDENQGQGAIKSSGSGAGFYFMNRSLTGDLSGGGSVNNPGSWWIWKAVDGDAHLWTPQIESAITVSSNGNVGIGIINPSNKLVVDGWICAKEIRVSLNGDPCVVPDYVFAPDYKLTPLKEVEQYVKKNRHLPGIPDAQTIAKDGMEMGTLNLKLLEKVEELTLHVIALEKQLTELKTKGGK